MNKEQEILVEGILYKQVSLFLEACKEEEKKEYVKAAILEFNYKYGTKTEDVIAKLKTMLKEKYFNELKMMKLQDKGEEPEF